MESKYYTPDIEEIYNNISLHYFDGFEVKDNIFVNPYIFMDDLQTINIGKDFEIEKVRVKYLDQEDIESLGFEFDSIFSDSLNPKNYETIYIRNENVVRYRLSLTSHKHISISGWFHDNPESPITRTLFRGWVKNKSEFKKLLKQLQIE